MIFHEERAVAFKAPVIAYIPSVSVDCTAVEVLSEVKVKCLGRLVVVVNFNKVVLNEPGHGCVIKSIVPGRPARRPKVHHKNLEFVHKRHTGRIRSKCFATLDPVYLPADIVRCPFDFVGME